MQSKVYIMPLLVVKVNDFRNGECSLGTGVALLTQQAAV
jgi:hypothetical protein